MTTRTVYPAVPLPQKVFEAGDFASPARAGFAFYGWQKYKRDERNKCAVLQNCAKRDTKKALLFRYLINNGGVSEDLKTHLGTPPKWRLPATSELFA